MLGEKSHSSIESHSKTVVSTSAEHNTELLSDSRLSTNWELKDTSSSC
jgi:hypothetical protein